MSDRSPWKTHPIWVVLPWLVLGACDNESGTGSTGGPLPDPVDAGSDAAAEVVALPGDAVPKIDCTGFGRTCGPDNPCASGLNCVSNVCFPEREDDASCTPDSCPLETPVCLAGTCVTRDELGCICTQVAARHKFGMCGDLERFPVSCIPRDGLCAGEPDACCGTLTCVQGEGQLASCQRPCDSDQECEQRCCTERDDVAGKSCAPLPFCRTDCRPFGEDCDNEENVCCEGLICSSSPMEGLDGCRERCTVAQDCDTGCCRLFTNRDFGVCADADFCP